MSDESNRSIEALSEELDNLIDDFAILEVKILLDNLL